MTFDQACKHITRAAFAMRDKPHHLIHYAATYARAGVGMTGEEARVQALYILNNLSSWRGDHAKETRDYLKAFAAGKAH